MFPAEEAMGAEERAVSFSELGRADLHVDAVYRSTGSKTGDDPLPRLLKVGNMGGFRFRGTLAALELVVLTSTLSDPDCGPTARPTGTRRLDGLD